LESACRSIVEVLVDAKEGEDDKDEDKQLTAAGGGGTLVVLVGIAILSFLLGAFIFQSFLASTIIKQSDSESLLISITFTFCNVSSLGT
jgi:uncharacterized protein YqhQ